MCVYISLYIYIYMHTCMYSSHHGKLIYPANMFVQPPMWRTNKKTVDELKHAQCGWNQNHIWTNMHWDLTNNTWISQRKRRMNRVPEDFSFLRHSKPGMAQPIQGKRPCCWWNLEWWPGVFCSLFDAIEICKLGSNKLAVPGLGSSNSKPGFWSIGVSSIQGLPFFQATCLYIPRLLAPARFGMIVRPTSDDVGTCDADTTQQV